MTKTNERTTAVILPFMRSGNSEKAITKPNARTTTVSLPFARSYETRWKGFIALPCIRALSKPHGLSDAIKLLETGAGWLKRKREFKREHLDEWDMLLVLGIQTDTTDWLIENRDVTRFPAIKLDDLYVIGTPAFKDWLLWASELTA